MPLLLGNPAEGLHDVVVGDLPRLVDALLPLPEARQARRRAQLPRFGPLTAGHLNRAPKAGLGLGLTTFIQDQQQFAL